MKKKETLRAKAERLIKSKNEIIDRLAHFENRDALIHELNVHQIELEMQNNELKCALLNVEESQVRYADLYDYAPVGYITMNEKGIILETNLTMSSMLENDIKTLTGRNLSEFILLIDLKLFASHLKSIFNSKNRNTCELRFCNKKGRNFCAALESIYIERDNNKYIRTSVIDITMRKEAEERINSLLREKEILLYEVHHRVKNNLQIISGIIGMMSHSVNDNKALEILKICQDRIRAISLIHETLFNSKDLSRVDICNYFNILIQSLLCPDKNNNISYTYAIENVLLPVNLAIPIGLILNELITNSLKYAFNNSEKGHIHTRIAFSDNNNLIMSVHDNGKGLPDDVDLNNPKTLGLQIVKALAGQIKGSIDVKSEDGTLFTIRCPLNIEYKICN